jgi:hypothetical protein
MVLLSFRCRALFSVSTLALVVSLTACGSGTADKKVVAATTTTAKAAPNTTDAALEAALIDSVPPGFVQVADAEAETGPTDKDKAISQEDARGGREVLAKSDYVNGYQRMWAKGEDALLAVAIYVFASEQSASEYNSHNLNLFENESEGATFAVDGVPGGKALHEQSSEGDLVAVGFQRGHYVVSLMFAGTGVDTATASSLALQQFKNLA